MLKPVLLIALCALSLPVVANDTVVDFANDDPQMNSAIAKARDSLPEFWARMADPAPNEEDFSLKLGVDDGDMSEHLWCKLIEGDADDASCVIANYPVYVTNVSYGERVDIDPDIISDWLYYRDDLIVGGETIRVMIDHLPKKEAAAMRAQMAEP